MIPHHINGLNVITDPRMLEDGEPVITPRTWRQRLFTRPWRPFLRATIHIPKVPASCVLMYEDKIVCHPEKFEEIKRQLLQKPY